MKAICFQLPVAARCARGSAAAFFLVSLWSTAARAQPGSVPPGPAPPRAPPEVASTAGPTPVRSGAYLDQRIGLGAFNIFDRGDGREDITRFAVGLHSEMGVHLGPFVSLFLDTSMVFHHYETAGDLAEWVYDDVGKWGVFDFFRVTFGTVAIPVAMVVDTQTNISLGMRFHFLATPKSPYAELGGGLSLLLDRPDGIYGGVYGAMGGFGYQLSDRYGVGARVLWAPVWNKWNSRGGGQGVCALFVVQVR